MNDLQKDELIAAQQRIIAGLQKELQWFEDLINHPGYNEIDMRLALQITPRKMRMGLIAEAPEKKIYIPAMAEAAHASQKTVSKRLKRLEKAGACSYRTAKDPTTGNTRAHLQVMPVLKTPAKIDLQNVDHGGGSTWEDGKRVKRCKDCGSDHLARKITMQVVCMDCGSAQEEVKTHFKQVNAPDATVNGGANSQSDTEALGESELLDIDADEGAYSQSDTEPDAEYEDEVLTPNSQSDTEPDLEYEEQVCTPNSQSDSWPPVEENPKSSALYDVNTVVYTEPLEPPTELQDLKQWVVWRYEENPGKPKPKKMPYSPWGRTPQRADPSDSSTWGTYQEAKKMYDEAIKYNMKTRWDGIGFAFANGYTGVDIDGCVTDGQITGQAWGRVQAIFTYTELSPSGTGVHAIAKGGIPTGRKTPEVEMYDHGRYFTWTGQHIVGTPTTIEDRPEQLMALYEEITPTWKSAIQEEKKPARNCVYAPAGALTDDEILDKAKGNAVTGDKFTALWDGDTSGYPSQSEADMALCAMLAYWTDDDAAAIDRLFRKSGLMREKWDRDARSGETYGEGTISRVLAQRNVA